MASYDPYERGYTRRHVREERVEDSPRYLDARDSPRAYGSSRDLVPSRELAVQGDSRDLDVRRARSAEPRYYDDDYYDRGYDDYDRDYDRRSRKGASSYYDEDERRPKSKGMSKQEKIIAAVAGAALLAGGKEFYDRREAKTEGHSVERNLLSSAALAGLGAFAAYQGAEFYSKQQAKKDEKTNMILQGRDGRMLEYYSDDEEGSKQQKGHKNFLESAMAATGLGAAVKSFTGGDSKSKSRSGSPSGEGGKTNKIQKAAMASLLAGATEAFRVSKEPGGWKGEKAKRIFTAAAGAATVDAAQNEKHGKLGMAESVIGGLVGNRLINGSKADIEEDGKGRSRSRSRARSGSRGGGGAGLAALATAGLGALGAKKLVDNSRSRSRGRDYDSRTPSPGDRRRSRSRSVVDRARNSLAKLGIGSGADEERRRDQDDYDDRGSRRPQRYDDEYDDDYRSPRGGRDYYDDDRSVRRSGRSRSRSRRDYTSESDLGDSDEDEKRAKKMKGKQLLKVGLAGVATVHAAHQVYGSMEKRAARQKAVKDGIISEAEAKKLKTKAIFQDAASVGLAAMGIKGAIAEFKEAKEATHECSEFSHEKIRRHERREERRRRAASAGARRAETWSPSSTTRDGYDSEDDYDYVPRYRDGNPYGSESLPAPPVGSRGR